MTCESRNPFESLLSDVRGHLDLLARRFGADGDDSEYAFAFQTAERLQRALAMDDAARRLDDVLAELRRAKRDEDPFLPLAHYLEHGKLAAWLEERP